MYWNSLKTRTTSLETGLTLTWDVLKCATETTYLLNQNGLTLTWDVLKWWQENWNLRRYRD